MHDSVDEWLADAVREMGLCRKTCLDMGAYDVNGNARKYFTGPYVGADMREGPGVDVVTYSWGTPFGPEQFDVVVCTEMLEHDEHPDLTFLEFARILKPGGVLLMSARGPGFPLHDYPADHWRFTVQDMTDWLQWGGFAPLDVRQDPGVPGVMATATRLAVLPDPSAPSPPLRPVDA